MHFAAQCDRIVDCQNNNVYLLKRLMCQEELVGAVYLLGNIYVIAKESFYLIYTGHSPYDLMDKILIDGMDPVDIATSYADICVYVLDDGNGRVSRIGHDRSLTTTVDGLERGNLCSMSVTMEGRLIIVKKNSVISTYGKDGSSISVISDPPLKPIIHAVEVVSNIFVVCNESATALITEEGISLQRVDDGHNCVSMNRRGNLIACNLSRHQVVELDTESLEVTDTLLTLDRDGIENPQHVQCVLENGMLLVSWMNFLDMYSFSQHATQGYLASSEHDTREQQHLEAERLKREITQTDTFKTLVTLYESAEMYSIFGHLQPEIHVHVQGLRSAFTHGECSVESYQSLSTSMSMACYRP